MVNQSSHHNKVTIMLEPSTTIPWIWHIPFPWYQRKGRNLLKPDNIFGVPKRDGVTDVSTFDYESLFVVWLIIQWRTWIYDACSRPFFKLFVECSFIHLCLTLFVNSPHDLTFGICVKLFEASDWSKNGANAADPDLGQPPNCSWLWYAGIL